MLVVGGGKDEHVMKVSVFDGAQQLLTALRLLQPLLRNAERKIYYLALPNVDGPVQGANDDLDLATALRAEYVSGIEPNSGRQGQDDVGDGRAVGRALPSF